MTIKKSVIKISDMKGYDDFLSAYHWLEQHPAFRSPKGPSLFDEGLNVDIMAVNPKTNKIEDDTRLNTKARIWLEHGSAYYEEREYGNYHTRHDTDLDCSGDTFEEAIMNLADKVHEHYGWKHPRTWILKEE